MMNLTIKAVTILTIIILLSIVSIPSHAQLIRPDDLEYIGAFRLPGVAEEAGWDLSGSALAYCPEGDPSGPKDGFPGSLFKTGHDHYKLISEISIPVPVNSPTKNLNQLNTAMTLQSFQDITGGLFPDLEIPRAGLEYLSTQGEQTTGKLYFCWTQHMGEEDTSPSHGWCELDLSHPQTAGAWRIGGYWTYVTTDYIFEIPKAWVDVNTPGMCLATGRYRDGGQGGQGPALFAYGPWNQGNPPAPGSTLQAIPLLLYGNTYEEDPPSLNNYHHSDEWSGGAWLTSGNRSAVIFVGTKGTGSCWYGCPDGTVWPDEPPYPPDCPDRGWWSTGFEGQMLFYDPDGLAAVVNGSMESWEPQPYAVMNIDDYLYNVRSGQQKSHVGAASFDRERGLLYILEPLVDNDKSIVHTWRIKPDSSQGSPRIRLDVNELRWDFAWVDRPSGRVLTIHNDGNGILEVTGLETDDPHFICNVHEMSIGALESENMTLTFTPSLEDIYEGTLLIECNDEENPELFVSLYGTGVSDCQGGAMGDVNGDGEVDVIDVVKVVNHILGRIDLPKNEACRADCNKDGSINILDVIGIINHILGLGNCGE